MEFKLKIFELKLDPGPICQLTEKQETELKATHNFGGGEGWFSGKVNNLPPKGITPINSFENDVMGITPVDDSEIENSF